MEKVSIIIPIHNILKRGLKRVRNSVISLKTQMEYIEDIIIVNSSNKLEYDMLDALLAGFRVKHISTPLHCFNKPILLNTGIKESNSKYVMCTDGDYLFSKDFMYICTTHRGEQVMLHKKVRMLPNMNLNEIKIDKWNFPKCAENIWGMYANGAVQYATKDFFLANPYPEEMDGFGAMDNLMYYMAVNNGLEVKWVAEGTILHQRHPIVNKMAGSNREKFDRNQQMLQDYKTKHNLADSLFKT